MSTRGARRPAFDEIGSGLFEPALHLTSALNGGWYHVALSQDHLLGHLVENVTGEPGGSVLEALLALAAGELSLLGARTWIGPAPRPQPGSTESEIDDCEPFAFLDAVSGGQRWIVAARVVWSADELVQTDRSRRLGQIVVGVDAGGDGPVQFARLCPKRGSLRDALWHPCREALVREVVVRPAFRASIQDMQAGRPGSTGGA